MEPTIEQKNFKRITNNPFFKNKLLEKYQNKCALCGKPHPIDKTEWGAHGVVHHLTHEHACIFRDLIEVNVKRVRKGQEVISKRRITQCEECFTHH